MMNEEKKIFESMSAMRASSDVYDQALARVRGGRRLRRGRALPLFAVLALCCAGMFGVTVTASAIVTGDPLFFMHAWTNREQSESSTWSVKDQQGDNIATYTREYGGVNAERVEEELEGVAEGVNLSVELSGYTLTIDSMAVDENGCGAATFYLENPDGVSFASQYASPGALVLNGDGETDGISALEMRVGCSGSAGFANAYAFMDEARSTSTRIVGTLYFDAGSLEAVRQGVSWELCGDDGDEEVRAETDVFFPKTAVETKRFSYGDGGEVCLSPMSIVIDAGNTKGDFVVDRIALSLADGGEYVVSDSEAGIENIYVGYLRADGTIGYVFSGLVDTSQVTGVEIEGRV